MTEDIQQVEQYVQRTSRLRRRGTVIFLIAVIIAAAVVLPPLVNLNRYQRQITALMTRSLGRPVKLSSVELKLLPRPGFVLNNLSVGEAEEFGVEPILSANSVVASIRLSALLTGKVEVDRISLDEASLNLVQSTPGRWNLEQIMNGGLVQGMSQTAPTTAQPVFRRQAPAFPYLEATNSRVNVKRGLEKYPYSLVNTQLSFWQESPGVWRLRLRGQPARTDMEISTADTGELRLEATLQTLTGYGLYDMPLKVQVGWREAQLGQLSRLLLGSDPGWRGELTADLTVQGTANEAQTRGRLRASGVRRAEFVPASPMDFDVNCGLLYEHSKHAVRNLDCDTGIGDGKLRLTGDLPGQSGEPEGTLAVDQMPLQAGLDMLRTLRSGFAPGLSADGKVSGELALRAAQPPAANAAKARSTGQLAAATKQSSTRNGQPQGPQTTSGLQGSFTISDGNLHGGALAHPLALPKIVLTAAEIPTSTPGTPPEKGLSTRFALATATAKNATPGTASATASDGAAQTPRGQELAVRLQLSAAGYQVGVNGIAAPERLRELAYAFGTPRSKELDGVTGGQADVQITGAGPWIPSTDLPIATVATKPATPAPQVGNGKASAALPPPSSDDALSGTIQLHRVSWAAQYLARPVLFPEAIVSLAGKNASVSGSFAYGALQGTVSVAEPGAGCAADACLPQVLIHMTATDAATIEGALLGAPEKKSLLSPLIDRVRSSQPATWPAAIVTFQAESLGLGPVTLHKPVFAMKFSNAEIRLDRWQAALLGGNAKGDGTVAWSGNQLHYKLAGSFDGLSGAQLGALLAHPAPAAAPKPENSDTAAGEDTNQPAAAPEEAQEKPGLPNGAWSGGPVDGSGTVELSGLTAKELAASAAGTVHFHWVKGTAPFSNAAGDGTAKGSSVARFDVWAGDANIGGGKLQLGNNSLTGTRNAAHPASRLEGSVVFGGPAKLTLAAPKSPETQAATASSAATPKK